MDLNAEIGKATIALIADYTKSLIAAGYGYSKEELQKISVIYGNAFKKYIARNAKRFQKIKTILDPSTPVSLLQIFESPYFKVGDENLPFDRYIEHVIDNKMSIVTGLGGSGKSVFSRYTFLHCARMSLKLIPIYVELRDVKRGITLESLIKKEINVKDNISDIGYQHALANGRFIFLFDAYDEIDEDNREDVGKEIKEIAYRYDDNIFFISSRPSDDFKDWHEFQISQINPLTKTQVLSLINRLKYESGAKDRFVSAIKERLLIRTAPICRIHCFALSC